MVSFSEFLGTEIELAHANSHRESQKQIEYGMARDRLLLPVPPNSSDFRNTKDFVRAGLAEVNEAITSYPVGVGELQNRGNLTLGAIQTQFERARDVLDLKRRESTRSLSWTLQYGAEQALFQVTGRDKNMQKPMKERLNSNLAKISRDLRVGGIKIETPQLP